MAKLGAGRPEAFMMLEEQDGGSLDRSNSGHGNKKIYLKYNLQVEFKGSHPILFSPIFHTAGKKTGIQDSNVESIIYKCQQQL